MFYRCNDIQCHYSKHDITHQKTRSTSRKRLGFEFGHKATKSANHWLWLRYVKCEQLIDSTCCKQRDDWSRCVLWSTEARLAVSWQAVRMRQAIAAILITCAAAITKCIAIHDLSRAACSLPNAVKTTVSCSNCSTDVRVPCMVLSPSLNERYILDFR